MKTSLAIQQAQAQLRIAALRKHQIKPIQSILDHHDTLVIALTSSGKSAIYQIAALTMAEKKGQWTLVVEPALSLISDQVQKLQKRHIPAAYITALNHAEHRQIYRDLNRGRISILYMTPEKVATVDFQLATRDTPLAGSSRRSSLSKGCPAAAPEFLGPDRLGLFPHKFPGLAVRASQAAIKNPRK